jgi:hypothetical protein
VLLAIEMLAVQGHEGLHGGSQLVGIPASDGDAQVLQERAHALMFLHHDPSSRSLRREPSVCERRQHVLVLEAMVDLLEVAIEERECVLPEAGPNRALQSLLHDTTFHRRQRVAREAMVIEQRLQHIAVRLQRLGLVS